MDLKAIFYGNPHAGMKLAGYTHKQPYDFKLEETLDENVLLKKLKSALVNGQKKSLQIDVSNVNRTFGTILDLRSQRNIQRDCQRDTFTINFVPEAVDKALVPLFQVD